MHDTDSEELSPRRVSAGALERYEEPRPPLPSLAFEGGGTGFYSGKVAWLCKDYRTVNNTKDRHYEHTTLV